MKWLDEAGTPEEKSITDSTYWYRGRINEQDLFVIYSAEDPAGKTILYEVKGKKAKVELNILLDLLEGEENGESINGEPSSTQTLSVESWVRYGNDGQNNQRNLGGRQNNQNAGVLPRQSQRNPSRAFWNVVENLLARRGDVNSQQDKQYSLEDFEEVSSKRKTEFLNAIDDLRNGKPNAADKLAKYVDNGMISTDDYDNLIERYGAIPEGERPFRDVQVPRKTEKELLLMRCVLKDSFIIHKIHKTVKFANTIKGSLREGAVAVGD